VIVRSFVPSDEAAWDAFCASAINATMLHTRRFLGYHGGRFRDRSAILEEGGDWVGLLPAAESKSEQGLVVSHAGATYGGLVHQGWLTGSRMLEAMDCLKIFYTGLGFKRLHYKAVPGIHCRQPAEDDRYAFFRLGARLLSCQLSAAIDLSERRPSSERRRRGLKKAQKLATLSGDLGLMGELWSVIAENLDRRHGAKPVHSLAELEVLAGLFPEKIRLSVALVAGKVEAGVIFFNSPRAWHAQYIASSEKGAEISALDWVMEDAIGKAAESGARYFDFGTSNEDGGRILNEGLFRFKAEFGSSGVAHEAYEMELGA
jgi:hypothetical protein